jgi:hypothetical protein
VAIQLTPDQEQRIQAIVNTGAFNSAEEALDAAVAAVELAVTPGFEGSQEELEGLLMRGVASKDLSEEDFWGAVNAQTDAMLVEGRPGPRP